MKIMYVVNKQYYTLCKMSSLDVCTYVSDSNPRSSIP
jgi:hypothetical protein